MNDDQYTLLVCTVGGSAEPIVATLKRWKPVRIQFVPTNETRDLIETLIIPMAKSEGVSIDPGRYDVIELKDGQDFAACVNTLRLLLPVVDEWLSRGEKHQVVADFTGGTKCMSAALALQAHRWRCVFSYVGGSERSKDGVGVVVSGGEQVLHIHNPWDSLGFQAVENFIALFDQLAFASAALVADQAMKNAGDQSRKRELNALKVISEAYDAWDRFDHKLASSKLNDLDKYHNDLVAILGQGMKDRLCAIIKQHQNYLQKLLNTASPSMEYVNDLLANSLRLKKEGRIDDAVARIYRSIESLAQVALSDRHNIPSTKSVSLEKIPEALRSQWASRAEKGAVFLGLQDAYILLESFNNDLGFKFKRLGLHDRERSPLTARNQSILAHGFERVSDKVFDQLWKAVLDLAQISEAELLLFPQIGTA